MLLFGKINALSNDPTFHLSGVVVVVIVIVIVIVILCQFSKMTKATWPERERFFFWNQGVVLMG